jgi:glycosyltransferase involved in cell wall biosynthesis
MRAPAVRALLYGDVDLNLIDGSAIWLQSIAETFTRAGCRVTVLLKAPIRTTRLTDPIAALPGVTLVKPFEDELLPGLSRTLSPNQAATLLTRLDQGQPFDLICLRGYRLVKRVIGEEALRGRLWTYLTDIPHSPYDLTAGDVEDLTAVARASRYLLCQTEELRTFLETSVPAACGRSVLFPPVIPDLPDVPPRQATGLAQPVKLVYTGKFAPNWNTLQMTEIPAALAGRGISAELHMVGDKIHDDPNDPTFSDRMGRALRTTPGVVWHGGRPRQEAMAIAAGCDIGLGWRSPALDASLEMSTKVLEFGAQGLPVVLNRTPAHEELLGRDYPFFVQQFADVLDVVQAAVRDPAVHLAGARACRVAAERFTLTRAAERVRGFLARAFPRVEALAIRSAPLKVVVAGHDLKFFTPLLHYLQALPGVEARVDQWSALAVHDPKHSEELLAWADVVICEWCGPNAVWYSRRKQDHQRLLVRLHRFELYAHYPGQVAIDAVDQVICVSPHYAELTRTITGWPAGKVVSIPNWVDDLLFDRSKLPGAVAHLGMIGIAPARKRLDLGLDVLEALRRVDPRFTLFVKTKMPWEYWWIWKLDEERAHYRDVFRRIQTSPRLRHAVVFDSFGPDVAAWLRKVGFVLSTSDDESFHLSPAEGMASGAVPVVRHWPGAETIYDRRWLHAGPAEMAEAIAHMANSGQWREIAARAQEQLRSSYSLDRVCRQWAAILTVDPTPVRPDAEVPVWPAVGAPVEL